MQYVGDRSRWSKAGIAKMMFRATFAASMVAASLLAAAAPAGAGVGDLLVAPTRLVLDGRKGAEVVLNNIGEEPATYRISVEFRRMTPDGGLMEVDQPTAEEKLAQDMIVYAPRRVTLAPRQPQSVRVSARAPQGRPLAPAAAVAQRGDRRPG